MDRARLRFLVEPGVQFEVPAKVSVPYEVVNFPSPSPREQPTTEDDARSVTPAPLPGGIESAPATPGAWPLPPIPIGASLDFLDAITSGQTMVPVGSAVRLAMTAGNSVDLDALGRFIDDPRISATKLSFEIGVLSTSATTREWTTAQMNSLLDLMSAVDHRTMSEGESEGSNG